MNKMGIQTERWKSQKDNKTNYMKLKNTIAELKSSIESFIQRLVKQKKAFRKLKIDHLKFSSQNNNNNKKE